MSCVAIDRTMPKKTRPITVLTAEELDALDDATFAELAADEERLHQALEDPASIRSGQALSIAKTKPRRQTVARQPILDPDPQDDDNEDLPGSDTGITRVNDHVSAQGAVVHGDAVSVTSTRGAVDHDDASTQVDEDLTMQPPPSGRGRDWYQELPLSTDPAVAIPRKSPKKLSIAALRETVAKPKTSGTAMPVVGDDQPLLAPVITKPRRAPAAKPQRPRPTVTEVRGLQDQLTISQASSAKQISLLRQQLTAQAQAFTAERDEMRLFMTNLMRQQRGEQVEVPTQPASLPIIDMVDDVSVDSELSYLTGESEGPSTVALSNVQLVMAPEPSTVVPQAKASARKEVVVPPKETAVTVAS